jgi:hypothetical protein
LAAGETYDQGDKVVPGSRVDLAKSGVAVAVRAEARQSAWSSGPRAARSRLDPDGGLEVLVLEGGFREGDENFGPQSWLRLPIGVHFSARAATGGCRAWVKEGHLRRIHSVQPAG